MLQPRARYTERLPATMVEPQVRRAVLAVAKAHGVTVSEVQRSALDLFLQQFANNTSKAANPDSEKIQRSDK